MTAHRSGRKVVGARHKPNRPRFPRYVPPSLREGSRWLLLRAWANMLYAYYGVPVWLCGSALKWGNTDPRDFDIRLELPAAEFRRRFGDPKAWSHEGATGHWTRVRWRWADDCVKKGREGSRRTGLNIDFQIYPLAHARALYSGERRLRLDTRGRSR